MIQLLFSISILSLSLSIYALYKVRQLKKEIEREKLSDIVEHEEKEASTHIWLDINNKLFEGELSCGKIEISNKNGTQLGDEEFVFFNSWISECHTKLPSEYKKRINCTINGCLSLLEGAFCVLTDKYEKKGLVIVSYDCYKTNE